MGPPAPADRPPFDARDEAQARRYLESRGLALVDPFSEEASRGDLIFTTSLSNARFILAQSFGTRNAVGQSFRAYPFIVGRPTANAFAVEDAGLQLCGIDIGLGTAAFEMSLFVFSQSALFREIGDAAGERSPSIAADSQLAFWIADQLRLRGRPDGPPVGIELVPQDTQRQRAAQHLTQLMLRFVWLHELYHGLNGHTGLLASQRPGAVLNEMADGEVVDLVETVSDTDAKKNRRQHHAMEFDADRSALWMLVRMQQIDLEAAYIASAWAKPLRLKLAIFAAAMMTFLFDQAAKRQAKQTGTTHPAAQHRLVDLVRTLASNLAEPPGEVKGAFKAVLAEMTSLEQCLPQFVSASCLLDDLHSTQLQGELDEIDDEITAARRQFAPFAYRAVSVFAVSGRCDPI